MSIWKCVPAVAAALLLGAASPARALRDEDARTVDRGLEAIYRGDYEGSEKIFAAAIQERPGVPALSLGYAVSTWWRMESDFAPPGGPEEKRFLAAVKRAIGDAERAAAGRDDPEAYLCLGGAYGLRGRMEASRKHWFKAYRDGRRAYRSEMSALQLDPELYDAYLGLGAFDYYAATLSRLVRLLVFAREADKVRGLSELRLARRGRFSGVAAKLLLIGIYWTFEKDPRTAWDMLEEVHAAYPESPMIASLRLIGLFQLRDAEGLEREARIFLDQAERGAPFYRPIDKSAGHYFLGLAAQLSGEPPFWGVQRYAKYLLKHPFRAGDNPLPSRGDELD